MDLKDYISSGVLENFVLGLLSENERSEVMHMMKLHPEVADYVRSLEHTLERYGQLHAAMPPGELKSAIMDRIRAQKEEMEAHQRIALRPEHNVSLWRKLAVAGMVLLLCSIGLNIYLGSKNNRKDVKIQHLSEQRQRLVTDSLQIRQRLIQSEKQIALLSDPGLQPITMNGVKQHPGIKATVYWSPDNRTVYLSNSELPDIPAGKAYQLWAIIDGKPVDLGLYTPKDEEHLPIQMKNTKAGKVQAFAITLEKEGGSPTPTMEQMYVMGPVS